MKMINMLMLCIVAVGACTRQLGTLPIATG
jgi:hypothetical protein